MIIIALLPFILGSTKRDFYAILGLPHDSTARDIEQSFMKLSRQHRPDRRKRTEEEVKAFEEINEAYDALRDPTRRRIYDLWGEAGIRVFQASQTLDSKHSMDELSSQVRVKGSTIRMEFPVDLIDIHEGRLFSVVVKRRTMCRCPEVGFFCEKCNGRPTIMENVTLTVGVERGMEEHSSILFKNAADVSEMNAPGDIELVIVTRKHPIFERKGADLHMNLDISVREALLGFKREIETIDGSKVLIESRDTIGKAQEIVVKGKGLSKYLSPDEFGDLIIHPRVELNDVKTWDEDKKTKMLSLLEM